MKAPRSSLVLLLLFVICFSLATYLQPRSAALIGRRDTDDILKILLGDGRRMFANHFFVKADVYFHRGYYPSFIEQSYAQTPVEVHIAEHHDGNEPQGEEAHEKEMDFLGKPRDWIDGFGRNFFPSTHTHRDQPGEAREILPWLRLSADLDPHRAETYTVAAYWLISNMGKINEAEQFLREGLRANPDSYQILFALGKIYYENRHDPNVARNLWELALRRWNEQNESGKDPDLESYDEIVAHLANLEEKQGNLREALSYLEVEVEVSPVPDVIQKNIDDLKAKLAATPGK
jgi:tetratricopeptide (TPR) repeat protein